MPTPRPSLLIRLTHTGLYADGRTNPSSVLINDLDVGYEAQDRKVPVYVPPGGHIDINASSRSMLSYEQGGIRKFTNAGVIDSQMFWIPESYTTIQLPAASTYPAGTYVWNLTEDTAYWSTGTTWTQGKATPAGPAGGDLGGTYPNPIVVGIEGFPVEAGTPNNGDALLFNSLTVRWEHKPIVFGGGPPVGPAGGDLGGLYPNPGVTGLQLDPLPIKTANGFLKRNAANTAWEEVGYGSTANTVCQGNDARLSDARPPTGAAGGDLSGNFPAPTVDGLQGRPVAATAPDVDAALTWTGFAWAPLNGGGLAGSYKMVTTATHHTASPWEVILVNTSGGAVTVTLPLAASCVGKPINIKKVSGDGYALNIVGSAGQLIDGQTDLAVTGQYNCSTLISDGSAWWII